MAIEFTKANLELKQNGQSIKIPSILTETKQSAITAINNKMQEALNSIPEDYTELNNNVNDVITKVNTIKQNIGDGSNLTENAISQKINTSIQNNETIQTMNVEIADLKKKIQALMNN